MIVDLIAYVEFLSTTLFVTRVYLLRKDARRLLLDEQLGCGCSCWICRQAVSWEESERLASDETQGWSEYQHVLYGH